MAVGFIKVQKFTTTGTRSSDTLAFVSGGSSRGMLLLSGHASTSIDRIPDGNVSYGGTNIPRFRIAQDTTGESMNSYGFFLGANVPQGDQNCVVTYNASNSTAIIHYLIQLSGSADLEIADSLIQQGDAANPSQTPSKGGISAYTFGILTSGQDDVSGTTEVSGLTETNTNDFGSQTQSVVRETSGPSTTDQAIGWTATIEDVALVAVAIREVQSVNKAKWGIGCGLGGAGGSQLRAVPIGG